MVEDRGNQQAAENLHMNLLELNFKIRHRVQDKIITVIALLLDVIELKIPLLVGYLLDPQYVMGLKDIKKYHHIENVNTKTLSRI